MSTRRHPKTGSTGDFGRVLAARQDEIRAAGGARTAARKALFDKPAIPGLEKRRWPIVAAVAAAAAVIALMLVQPWAGSAVVAGGSYAATSSSEVLRFEDGSEVTLEPGSRARVDRVDARGSSIALREGALFARVTHRADTDWSFRAGDYLVKVTGTAFELRWTPPRVELVMHEGSVLVTGPGLSEPQRVTAGQSAVFPPEPRSARAAAPAREPASPLSPPPGVASAKQGPAEGPAAATSASAQRNDDGWQARAARGDHKGAYEEVAPRLDSELASRDAGSLVRLATVARLSGHPQVARRVYLAIRERFPGTPSAAEAAFSMGTLAFGSGSAEAERWFQLALVEAPGSGLAASARGRLLELAIQRGDAKAAAREYLRHHPDGPHAAVARKALTP